MTQFHFVAPTPSDVSEGGDAYNAGLAGALAALGHGVGFGPLTAAPAGATVVVDSLAVPGIDPGSPGLEQAVGLVHHTTALAATADKPHVQAVERAVLPRLRRVVASSAVMAERLSGFGVAPERVTVLVPGAPDVPRATGSGGCHILAVGALVQRKGHDVLLRALARLTDLDWTATIAGDATRDPACAAALAEQASQAGISSRVRFAGSLTNDALAAEWLRAEMFALATRWEGYATAVAEALRRGLPAIVTAGGGTGALLSLTTGIVCPIGDADGFSKGLRRLIYDTRLRAVMAEAAFAAGQALPGWPEQAARFVAVTGGS